MFVSSSLCLSPSRYACSPLHLYLIMSFLASNDLASDESLSFSLLGGPTSLSRESSQARLALILLGIQHTPGVIGRAPIRRYRRLTSVPARKETIRSASDKTW